MVSDAVIRTAAAHLTVGVATVVAGTAIGGFLATAFGFLGLLVYAVVGAVALYFGLTRVVRGVAVLADGLLDARFGTDASSSALDARSPFQVPLSLLGEAGDVTRERQSHLRTDDGSDGDRDDGSDGDRDDGSDEDDGPGGGPGNGAGGPDDGPGGGATAADAGRDADPGSGTTTDDERRDADRPDEPSDGDDGRTDESDASSGTASDAGRPDDSGALASERAGDDEDATHGERAGDDPGSVDEIAADLSRVRREAQSDESGGDGDDGDDGRA
jgi:hypothetical protein